MDILKEYEKYKKYVVDAIDDLYEGVDVLSVFDKSELNNSLFLNFIDKKSHQTTIEEIVDTLTEDFGIGVGAPLGADQGIPLGGDCKAVIPCRMGAPMRRPIFNPTNGLNGKPKRKNKLRRKRKKSI